MSKIDIKEIIENLIDTFLYAGKISIELRKDGLIKKIKEDKTPVSNGDLEVNKIITKKILELTPNIPIVSEESSQNKDNDNLTNFWLIDPIDGTYDYINNLDEFTINACLIQNQKPSGALVYAPAKKRLFYSFGLNYSFELTNGKLIKLTCEKNHNNNFVRFVSHSKEIKPDIVKIHKRFKVKEYVRMKSSLKFCVIAAGEFDGYAAEARAYEWDIAAGHAILEHAGGVVTDFDGNQILYGKKNFYNPSLILKSKTI